MTVRPAAQPQRQDVMLQMLADYASRDLQLSAHAVDAAQIRLVDALACAFGAAQDAGCRRVLDALVAACPNSAGIPVPATRLVLDPQRAAFALGALVRWLDFSDTTFWGGHPSDNVGAIVVAAAMRERAGHAVSVGDLLRWLIRVYEIHGGLIEANRFDSAANALDNVFCAKVATAGIAAHVLGGNRDAVLSALSHAWADGQSAPVYRHAPNLGPRKSWAAADAAARGLWFAQLGAGGEPPCPTAISADPWGLTKSRLHGIAPKLDRVLSDRILVESTILKLVPGQRNGTTAIEAALRLHARVIPQIPAIREVRVYTHDEAMRRINVTGPLPNPEARDHCLQYMVAAALIYGRMTSWHYSDEAAAHPQLEPLRAKVRLIEHARFSRGHHDPEVRSCANAIEIEFADGTKSEHVEALFPAGDPRQGDPGGRLLAQKFETLAGPLLGPARLSALQKLFAEPEQLRGMALARFLALLVADGH
jgi:2-methylcitrate dehydratase